MAAIQVVTIPLVLDEEGAASVARNVAGVLHAIHVDPGSGNVVPWEAESAVAPDERRLPVTPTGRKFKAVGSEASVTGAVEPDWPGDGDPDVEDGGVDRVQLVDLHGNSGTWTPSLDVAPEFPTPIVCFEMDAGAAAADLESELRARLSENGIEDAVGVTSPESFGGPYTVAWMGVLGHRGDFAGVSVDESDVVETVAFAITALNQGAKWFKVAGDHREAYADGLNVHVVTSTGNDGSYIVDHTDLDAGDTRVFVVEAIPDATPDGQVNGEIPGVPEVTVDEEGALPVLWRDDGPYAGPLSGNVMVHDHATNTSIMGRSIPEDPTLYLPRMTLHHPNGGALEGSGFAAVPVGPTVDVAIEGGVENAEGTVRLYISHGATYDSGVAAPPG